MSKDNLIPELRFPEFVMDVEWKFDILSNYADVVDPHPSHRAPSAVSNGIPFIGIGDISERGVLDKNNVRLVSLKIYEEHKERYNLKTGDFAYGRVASVGKIVDLSNNIDKIYTYSPTMAIIQSKDINSNFLRFFCNSNYFISQVEAKTSGSTRKSIGMQNLRILNVCLPDSPQEQQKIASCLSSLDEVISAHTQKLEALKDHKKGLMQNLFPQEGETVPKYRFPEFEDDGDWEEEELGKASSYVDYRGKTPTKSLKGVFLVTAKNIKEGYIDYEISQEYIPNEFYEGVMSRGKPKIGDVLITTEAPLGNVASIDREDIALAQRVIKFRGKKNIIDNSFLKHTFLSQYFQYKLEKNSSGSTAKGIRGSILRKLIVSFTSINEQQKIASCLSSLDAIITEQVKKIAQLKLHKKGLMQGLFPKID